MRMLGLCANMEIYGWSRVRVCGAEIGIIYKIVLHRRLMLNA